MPSAHVIGLGKSGVAAAHLLKRQGWQVEVSDSQTSALLEQQKRHLENSGIAVHLKMAITPESVLACQHRGVECLVVSPGVPWDLPGLCYARSAGLETIGETEVAWRHLRQYPWVGITGTNGKTTTTALIAAIFQTAGFRAPACGNIGYTTCEVAVADSPPDWVIAELSSYQIESSPSITPRIGVWTTFTPDHLNRHKTLENYYNIKAHLLRQAEHQVFNGDDPYLRQVGPHQWSNACWTSIQGKDALISNPAYGTYIEEGWVIALGQRILPANTLRMLGQHNLQNLLMAVAAACLAGIEREAIVQAIASFPGVPHRLEHVRTWRGIEFINDSKATNYDAAQVGLASVEAPVILIAGGEAKIGDDRQWLNTIHEKVSAVLLIGSSASQFAQRLRAVNFSRFEIVETMDRAIDRAATLAQLYRARVVLLSPACASFDQYPNFEERGKHFQRLCQQL